MVCTHPAIPTNTNLDPGRPRLTKVGQDRHTTVGKDLPRWAGFASVGMLDQRRPTPIRVDQCRLGWAVRRRRSVKVGTSVPMGGSECSVCCAGYDSTHHLHRILHGHPPRWTRSKYSCDVVYEHISAKTFATKRNETYAGTYRGVGGGLQ